MAGMSLAQAQTLLDQAIAAYTSLTTGTIQSYVMPDGRSVTYANRKDLLDEIDRLEFKVQRLSRGGFDVKNIVITL